MASLLLTGSAYVTSSGRYLEPCMSAFSEHSHTVGSAPCLTGQLSGLRQEDEQLAEALLLCLQQRHQQCMGCIKSAQVTLDPDHM